MKLEWLSKISIGMVAGALITAGITLAQHEDGGIPTSRGVDHVGLTVPSLDEAIGFFESAMGCIHVYTAGPFNDPEGDWMTTTLAVHPRASLTLAMIRCGPTQNVELFEYDSPDEVLTPPKNSDVGGNHIAFYVDDMDEAVSYLETIEGVTLLGTPTPVAGQPNGGEVFFYFLSPWGSSMELVSYNDGMEYEQTTDKRLYSLR